MKQSKITIQKEASIIMTITDKLLINQINTNLFHIEEVKH